MYNMHRQTDTLNTSFSLGVGLVTAVGGSSSREGNGDVGTFAASFLSQSNYQETSQLCLLT